MKTLATLHMTQPRIATGMDQNGKTVLHLLQGIHNGSSVELHTAAYTKKLTGWPLYAQDLGTVEIIHPWCMAGTPEEFFEDVLEAAYDKLERDDIIVPNDYGIYFTVQKEER